jgi:hypothetical protein
MLIEPKKLQDIIVNPENYRHLLEEESSDSSSSDNDSSSEDDSDSDSDNSDVRRCEAFWSFQFSHTPF